MCTILTVSKAFYDANQQAVVQRLNTDAFSNDDGLSVLMLGDSMLNDLQLSGMKMSLMLPIIVAWMDKAGPSSRLFVHQRMATTAYVGVPFNHGFTDLNGCVIMHNGILHSKAARAETVDSFALIDLPGDVQDAMISLLQDRETYANVFRIWPNESKYQVIRMSTGNLHTDGLGNYSSNPVASINRPVKTYSEFEHKIEGRDGEVPKPAVTWWKGYSAPTGNSRAWMEDDLDDDYYGGNYGGNYGNRPYTSYSGASHSDTGANAFQAAQERNRAADKATAQLIIDAVESVKDVLDSGPGETEGAETMWAFDEGDLLVMEDSQFFVIFNKANEYMFLYDLSTGELVFKERCYMSAEEIGEDVSELTWQGRLMIEDALAGERLTQRELKSSRGNY